MTVLTDHGEFLSNILARQADRRREVDPSFNFPSQPILHRPTGAKAKAQERGPALKTNVVGYVPEEETVRNDYTAWYGLSGRTGARYILGAKEEELCDE